MNTRDRPAPPPAPFPSPKTPPSACLVRLNASRADEAVEVLAEAFRDYPVMIRILGPERAGDARRPSPVQSYERRLSRLVRFFVRARVVSGHPILALESGNRILAAATISLPGPGAPNRELDVIRAGTWAILGPEARARYEELCRVWGTFDWPEPHHHLNMIGVRRAFAGQGLGRRLLDAVHALAAEDAGSAGVSLTTETASNVELYRHVGYHVVAAGRLPGDPRLGLPDVRSWGLFRPTPGTTKPRPE